MKRIVLVMAIIFIAANGGYLGALDFSGVFDSSVSMQAGAGSSPDFSCGIEQFANIRFLTRFRGDGGWFEGGRFEGAVNLFAAAGDYAVGPAFLGIASGNENYVAGIELERLFFKLNFKSFDLDSGLIRIPFGYSQIWGSMDFLNPPNPLNPTARPRGVLGSILTWDILDQFKLAGFGVAPRNPLELEGGGGFLGISAESSWKIVTLQGLYSYELPDEGSKYGAHRAGLSLKADIKVNFIIDALYTYNHEAETEWEGLSFSTGLDYSFSFFDGGVSLLVLAEYLYNGAASSTALGHGGFFSNEHYLSTALSWNFVDYYTTVSFTLISGFSDISFTPVISVNHELFQGALLTFTAQIPLDRDLFSGDGNRGELGPISSYFNFSTRLRLRF